MEKPEAEPKETIETRSKTDFLDRLKTHKFLPASRQGKILAGVLLALVFAGAVFGAYKFGQRQVQPAPQPTPEAIATPTTQLLTPTPTKKPTSSSTPTPIAQNYPRPSSWKTTTIPSMKISLCLAPKWVVGTDHYPDDYREIFFERDPNYRPRATSISKIPYLGGSRREEYINSKVRYEHEPEKLKEETTVKEIIINDRSVLDIAIPSFPEELVFTMDDFLYSVDVSYDALVNDSPSAFRKDIYTIVGCIKPI